MTHVVEKYKGIAQIGSLVIGIAGLISVFYWNQQSSLSASVNEIRGKEEIHAVNMAKLETRIDNIDRNVEEIKKLIKEIK